jgi:NADH-ubiquinone oxidoreductase chain 2
MVLISSIFLLLANAVTFRRDKCVSFNRVTILILLYSAILGFNSLYVTSLNTGIGIYGGLFHSTAITQSFVVFICILGIIILQLTSFYPRRIYDLPINQINNELLLKDTDEYDLIDEQIRIIEYPLIILFILTGAIFLMSSCDLISMFLSIELQSYGLYILATLYRNSELATSAGLTYFLLGGLSSCFILLGSSLLYVNTGVTYLDSIYILYSLTDSLYHESLVTDYKLIKETIIRSNEINSSQSFNLALLILSVGYLFKVSSAPFHFWSPDVYDSLPTIVTTFVAIVAKISIFIFILDLVHYINGPKSEFT